MTAVIVGLAAAAVSRWPRTPAPTPRVPFAATAEPTSGQRLDAMVSVRAHALWPDGDFPAGFRPMPLERAAALIRNDADPFAPSRRRRAIATLAGYGWRAGSFPPPIARALDTLGADPQALLREIDDAGPAARADGPMREARVYDAVERDRFGAVLLVSGCHTTKLSQWVSPPTKPSVTSWITISVNRTVDDLARSLDPQSWKQCSKLFVKSYLAVDPGTSTADPTADTPVTPGTAYPSTAVVPGTPYPWRLFFEHYDGHCPGGCWYKNLLDVRTWYEGTSPHTYRVRYELNRYLAGSMSLKIDGGGLSAEPITGGTGGATVNAWKTLQFDSTIGNAMIAAVLRQSEAAALITEMACCDVPSS
jgi:hypothetical protein